MPLIVPLNLPLAGQATDTLDFDSDSGISGHVETEASESSAMNPCRAIQQSDEMYCAPCNLRWDVNDGDAPRCRPEISSADPLDLTTRAQLEAVAAGYSELAALQVKQRKTMALMLKLCIVRLNSPDSRKRGEGITALTELMVMLEKQA